MNSNPQPKRPGMRATALALAAFLALLSFGCSGGEKDKEPVVSVESALVQRTRLQRTVTA